MAEDGCTFIKCIVFSLLFFAASLMWNCAP